MSAIRTALDAGFAVMLAQEDVTATYTPLDGDPVSVSVIFDEAYEILTPVAGLEVGSTAPAAWIDTDDAPDAARGDQLVVDSVTYEVLTAQPDGLGVTRLLLSKDSTIEGTILNAELGEGGEVDLGEGGEVNLGE